MGLPVVFGVGGIPEIYAWSRACCDAITKFYR